jgi:hypothetical protein
MKNLYEYKNRVCIYFREKCDEIYEHQRSVVVDSAIEKHVRCSNLELYRIFVMLLIVAHHYVVNSGLIDIDGPIYANPLAGKSLFYECFGAWGKTGVNCFVLITGYFMCKSHITVKKFIKLFAEMMFYRVIIWIIFLFSGVEKFSVKDFFKMIIPIQSVQQNFTGCYLIFFLFIPFLNIMIGQLDEKKHLILLGLCMFTYIFFGTFHRVSMNYVSWYIVLFIIGSYIRLYSKPCFYKKNLWILLTTISVLLSIVSVICCAWIAEKTGRQNIYYFVSDSNTLLAVTNSVCSFMVFKNMNIRHSIFINMVAASTFGVLCIHTCSDAMRQWLWKDMLNNVGMYNTKYFAVHAIGSVVGVFVVCVLIDYLRIHFLERRIFR